MSNKTEEVRFRPKLRTYREIKLVYYTATYLLCKLEEHEKKITLCLD